MIRSRHVVLVGVALFALSGGLMAQQVDTTGTGWRLANLDMNVEIHATDPRLSLQADLLLRLVDHEHSNRLMLALNSRDSVMAFDSVVVIAGTVVALNRMNPDRGSLRETVIDLSGSPRNRGEEVRVRVFASSRTTAQQFTLGEDVALASWVTVWYPIPMPSSRGGLSAAARATGQTTFDLPPGWRAVSNGVRAEVGERSGRRTERWVTEQPLARSFVAAPFRELAGEAEGRRVTLFLLTIDDGAAQVQADALAGSIAALERRFGPYPTGDYAIAEVPEWVPGFLAASEQGFMMAKPETFLVLGGNIPLFAHEAAHGYWGNLVTSSGPGSSFLSESIAQYGAVLAIEDMLGKDSALAFLKFSREGYIPLQSARGYFEVVRRGADSVAIADMANLSGMAKRIVVDSKGTWVYQMLRQLMGDELFFATLRSYIATHADGSSTLAAFRAFVAESAPNTGVEEFFAQWLDHTGAPRLESSWVSADGGVTLVVTQTQQEAAYTLDLDVMIQGVDGAERTHTIRLDGSRGEFHLAFAGEVAAVILDPEFCLLRWDESYQMESR